MYKIFLIIIYNNMKNKIYELLDVKKIYPKKYKKKENLEYYIWKNKLLFRTSKENKKIKSTRKILPHGLKIQDIKPYKNDKKILLDFIKYFKDYMIKNEIKKKNEIPYEVFGIFNKDTKVKTKFNLNKTFNIINKCSNNDFKKIIKYYFINVLKCFNIDLKKDKKLVEKIYNETYFGIFKYNINKDPGLICHLDNFTIGNNKIDINGPLVTITIGQDFYYDFIPIYYTEKNIKKYKDVRLKVHNNQIVIMDGSCRINWLHCVPYGYIKKDKITLKFKLPCLGKYNSVYNNFFYKNISTSYKGKGGIKKKVL